MLGISNFNLDCEQKENFECLYSYGIFLKLLNDADKSGDLPLERKILQSLIMNVWVDDTCYFNLPKKKAYQIFLFCNGAATKDDDLRASDLYQLI